MLIITIFFFCSIFLYIYNLSQRKIQYIKEIFVIFSFSFLKNKSFNIIHISENFLDNYTYMMNLSLSVMISFLTIINENKFVMNLISEFITNLTKNKSNK